MTADGGRTLPRVRFGHEGSVRTLRSCAFEHAHAPYSGFRVGAAVRGASGKILPGRTSRTPAIPRAAAPRRARSPPWSPPASGASSRHSCWRRASGCARPAAAAASGSPSSRRPTCRFTCATRSGLRRTVTLGELLPLSFGLGGDGVAPAATPRTGAVDVIRAKAPGLAPRVGHRCSGPGSAGSPMPWKARSPFPTPSCPVFHDLRSRATRGASCSAGFPACRSPACRAARTSTKACRRPRSTARCGP